MLHCNMVDIKRDRNRQLIWRKCEQAEYPAQFRGLAWISTERNWPNAGASGAVVNEAKRAIVPPWDGEDDGEVGAAMEAHRDFAVRDGDVGGHVDEVAEDQSRLGLIVAAHAAGHEP